MWLLRNPENMPPIKVVPTAINAKIKPTSQCRKFTATRHRAGNADAETNLITHIQFCRWLNKYIITLNLKKTENNTFYILKPMFLQSSRKKGSRNQYPV